MWVGVFNAPPDAGDTVEHPAYLTVPGRKFPRDMAIYKINENYQEVRKAHVKDIAGLLGLGCFKRWFRGTSDNSIDARWVVTWKMVGGQCRR